LSAVGLAATVSVIASNPASAAPKYAGCHRVLIDHPNIEALWVGCKFLPWWPRPESYNVEGGDGPTEAGDSGPAEYCPPKEYSHPAKYGKGPSFGKFGKGPSFGKFGKGPSFGGKGKGPVFGFDFGGKGKPSGPSFGGKPGKGGFDFGGLFH
jgi:hypothetical protein